MNSSAEPGPAPQPTPAYGRTHPPALAGRLAFLFFFAVAMHSLATWSLPLLDRDEPRFAEASREMVQRHDYFVPYLNNNYRFDKPPLIYWCQSSAYRAFGESEWAARLPSVLASAFTALLIYGFGRRAFGDRAGFMASLIFTTSLQTLIHSKLALADAWMVCFVVLTAWSGWELTRTDPPPSRAAARGWWTALTVALALGFLAKGPVAWLPLGMIGWLRYRAKTTTQPVAGKLALALMVSLGLIALWAVPALIQTQWDYFRIGIGKHVVARGLVSMDGHGSSRIWGYVAKLPFYFLTVFPSFFPWCLFLPGLVRRLWQQRGGETIVTYLVSGIVLTFGLFTFYNTKLPHYTWPAFPFLALLLARQWDLQPPAAPVFRRGVVAMVGLNLALSLVAVPLLAGLAPSRALARECAPWLRPDMEFASVDYQEPSLVWYFRETLRGFHQTLSADQVGEFMARPGPRLCIVPESVARPLLAEKPAGWQVVSVRGFNVANGKWVSLRALIKPEDNRGR